MKKLLISAACLLLIAFQAPVYAGGSDAQEKPCSGMNDGSFECASWLAAETFYDLIGQPSIPQDVAIDACLEVLTDQLGKGVGGSTVDRRGSISLTISAKNNILACVAK